MILRKERKRRLTTRGKTSQDVSGIFEQLMKSPMFWITIIFQPFITRTGYEWSFWESFGEYEFTFTNPAEYYINGIILNITAYFYALIFVVIISSILFFINKYNKEMNEKAMKLVLGVFAVISLVVSIIMIFTNEPGHIINFISGYIFLCFIMPFISGVILLEKKLHSPYIHFFAFVWWLIPIVSIKSGAEIASDIESGKKYLALNFEYIESREKEKALLNLSEADLKAGHFKILGCANNRLRCQ